MKGFKQPNDCCKQIVVLNTGLGQSLQHSNHCPAGSVTDKQKHDMIKAELDKVSENRPLYERITAFSVINEPFSPDNGTLTRSMKVRRDAVMQRYAVEVDSLRKRLR